jgi:hypothetical protein
MAQKMTVALEDDLDGGPADETVRFRIGGNDYEIDLSNKNATAFRRQLAPFIDHARTTGRRQRRRPGRSASSRDRSGGIRAWAKARASRSATAGASPPTSQSSTKPPAKDPDTSCYTGGPNPSWSLALTASSSMRLVPLNRSGVSGDSIS